jgi:hypothetical protein
MAGTDRRRRVGETHFRGDDAEYTILSTPSVGARSSRADDPEYLDTHPEFVIDRYGLDDYLPFYQYGDVCLWDIAVIIGIAVPFVKRSRPPRSAAAT